MTKKEKRNFIRKNLSITNFNDWGNGKYGFCFVHKNKMTESFSFDFECLLHYLDSIDFDLEGITISVDVGWDKLHKVSAQW